VRRVEPDSARTILEAAHDAFVTLDGEGRVLDWNPRRGAVRVFARGGARVRGGAADRPGALSRAPPGRCARSRPVRIGIDAGPVPISRDETLLLYTGGVIDTRGESDRFGTDRLSRLLAKHAGKPPAEMLAELELELDRYQSARPSDDTAAVALRAAPARSLSPGPRTQPGEGVRTLRTI
jgi:hypothetical protein